MPTLADLYLKRRPARDRSMFSAIVDSQTPAFLAETRMRAQPACERLRAGRR